MKKLLLFILFASQFAFGVTANKVWRVPSGGSLPTWGPVNLADTTNAVTGTLPASSLGSNPNFSGSAAQENSKNLVVSNSNATASLAIIRGGGSTISSNCGNTVYGEGYSCNRTGTGLFSLTFTNAFADSPVCTCTSQSNLAVCDIASSPSTSGFSIELKVPGGGDVDSGHFWICIGQRS